MEDQGNDKSKPKAPVPLPRKKTTGKIPKPPIPRPPTVRMEKKTDE